jgi:hypothetical protein
VPSQSDGDLESHAEVSRGAILELIAYFQAVPDGPDRDRTCDLGIKSPLLYQLSYRPVAASVDRVLRRPAGRDSFARLDRGRLAAGAEGRPRAVRRVVRGPAVRFGSSPAVREYWS